MSKPIALIFGAGKRIGASTAEMLASKGYRVALAARSLKSQNSTEDSLHLTTDLSNPESVTSAFATLRKQWGEPSVVVYNAAAAHFTSPDDPTSVSNLDFAQDLAINTTSTYAAVKEALASFKTLPSSAPKTFFYTGNLLNKGPQPRFQGLLTLGVGKAASAYLIESVALAHAKDGIKFFYVDERKADGSSGGAEIDGPAHADFFASLLEGNVEVPTIATFVKGKGYVDFSQH